METFTQIVNGVSICLVLRPIILASGDIGVRPQTTRGDQPDLNHEHRQFFAANLSAMRPAVTTSDLRCTFDLCPIIVSGASLFSG
jgi:hypothetical protein